MGINGTYKWYCSRCGQCCINTITETELGKYGVFLLPHERFLFPEQYVKPMYGIGIKGHSRPRPKVIHAYQNISQPCVWYEPELRECMIYDRRPLGCMEFPLSRWHGGVMMHRECPTIAEMLPENVMCTANELRGLETELEAVKKMTIYYMGIFVLNVHKANLNYCWAYDLNKNKWVRWKDEQLERFTKRIDEKVKAI